MKTGRLGGMKLVLIKVVKSEIPQREPIQKERILVIENIQTLKDEMRQKIAVSEKPSVGIFGLIPFFSDRLKCNKNKWSFWCLMCTSDIRQLKNWTSVIYIHH